VTLKTYSGSCHCGAVKYQASIDLTRGTAKCNCTFCLKARAWKAFVQPAAFRLLDGADRLVSYHAHPQAPEKLHCAVCGVRTHERGNADYMGGEFVAVFVNTLDDAAADELVAAPVRYSDGLHNNWQNPPEQTAHL
jgi:hypothetical protein